MIIFSKRLNGSISPKDWTLTSGQNGPGVIEMKWYSTFPKGSEMEPHYQIV